MNYEELVRQVLKDMKLLDANGALIPVDSITLVDLIVRLEADANAVILPSGLGPENFTSVESIAKLLASSTSAVG